MSGLSTKHVVLGLVLQRPGYGYDLQQRLASRLGFLGLSENAVYKILDRLEEDGWIKPTDANEDGGGTTRRALRVTYEATDIGRLRFKEWLAMPSDRAVLRDELQAKAHVTSDPEDLPLVLRVAEEQQRACLSELGMLKRPALARVADPEVPWMHCAKMMTDEFSVRWLQFMVDWLDAICELMEERIQRTAALTHSTPQ